MKRGLHLAAWIVAALLLASCSTASYYTQSVSGHLDLLRMARPIDDWLADASVPAVTKTRLKLVAEIRRYAVTDLGLPDNASYRSYADIHRPYVVWNVFAAPELSLELKQWCFLVAGCVSYRGYYDQAAANAYADGLKREGWDVYVGGVPAYSTLGYTADPVLSTFINYPEGEIARMIFHELAHQIVYVQGDSMFNESFATAVEEEGVKRWLAYKNDPVLTQQYALHAARKKAFLALLTQHQHTLESAYGKASNDAVRRVIKRREFFNLKQAYALAQSDTTNALYNDHAYDRYFAQELNNAHLAAISTYTQLLPFFSKLLARQQGNLERFYSEVKVIAKLRSDERNTLIQAAL